MLINAGCRVHLFSSGNLGSVPKDAGQVQLYTLEKGSRLRLVLKTYSPDSRSRGGPWRPLYT